MMANSRAIPKWLNFVRAISNEGTGRIRFFKKVKDKLENDQAFRAYFEQETSVLPKFYLDIIKKDMGYMWDWLPEGAIYHDHKAYLNKQMPSQDIKGVSA